MHNLEMENRYQRQESNTYICIDFDSTIVDHAFPKIGEPVPGAIEGIKRLQELSAKIILFTIRTNKELHDAISYLWNNDIELFASNYNPNQASWSSSRKVYAHRYIDDLAAGVPLIQPEGFARPCVDWAAIMPDLEKFLKSR